MIDLDYRCHDIFKFSYKGTKPKKDPRCQVCQKKPAHLYPSRSKYASISVYIVFSWPDIDVYSHLYLCVIDFPFISLSLFIRVHIHIFHFFIIITISVILHFSLFFICIYLFVYSADWCLRVYLGAFVFFPFFSGGIVFGLPLGVSFSLSTPLSLSPLLNTHKFTYEYE